MALINEVLDFSKIEAGKIVLDEIQFNLEAFIDEVVDIISWKTREKGIELQTSIDPAFRTFFYGDPVYLRQILLNLAGNAVKFTASGEINIQVIAHEEQGRPYALFTVKDTGIGISATEQSKLFKAFTQADGTTTRKYGGTGLGLSICKELVELMGGTIGVESTIGQGSCFYFTVPVKKQELLAMIPPTSKESTESNLFVPTADKDVILPSSHIEQPSVLPNVLLVEDNAANQYLATLLLGKLGYAIKLAVNGREAVAMAQAESFDIILMDCQMPEMDGFEATKLLRDLEKQTGIHVPIIAMTANAVIGDKERCLEVGMDDYISKPIKGKLLQQILLQWRKNN